MPAKRRVRPRKMPTQARAKATVEVIMEAAARILVRHGFEGMTTNRVAEKAGVSVGSLYQYFPNKESLVAELELRHHAELRAAFEEALPQAREMDVAGAVSLLIQSAIKVHRINPELHRVLSEEIPRIGTAPEFKAFEQEVYEILKAFFNARRSEICVPDTGVAAFIVLRAVEASVHDTMIHQSAPQDLGLLGQELSRMITLYLTGGPVTAKQARTNLGKAA